MFVMTLASGLTMFVASSRPPKPVSQITRSHFCSAKNFSAMTRYNFKKRRVMIAMKFFEQRLQCFNQPDDFGFRN